MKFCQKYPLAKYLDEPEESVIRGKELKPCDICKNDTFWIEISFSTYVCSEECQKELWKRYAKSFKREGSEEK